MPRWKTPAHKLGTAQWSRHRLVLGDGRLLEWSEQQRVTGRPLICLGYIDGRPITDDELLEHLSPRRSTPSAPPPAA